MGRSYQLHGKRFSRAYTSWVGMKTRCLRETYERYHDYGGRGIRIHEAWINDFAAFHEYVGDPPTRHHSIDRIDNDGHYEPGNIRWATRKQQASNRRNTLTITNSGMTLPISEWASRTGLTYNTILSRFYRGFPENRIFERS